MRMRLPEGCAGVVHAGRPLAVTDGTVEVSPKAAAALLAHGLVPLAEGAAGSRPAADRQAERQAVNPPGAGRQPDRRPR